MIISDFTDFFLLIWDKAHNNPLIILLFGAECCLFSIYLFKRFLSV